MTTCLLREPNSRGYQQFVALEKPTLAALPTLERESHEKKWQATPINVNCEAVAPPARLD